jgi:hypothetical protein
MILSTVWAETVKRKNEGGVNQRKMDANLKKILKSGESETVEFKQSLAEKDQILETVSAFSNARGGSI